MKHTIIFLQAFLLVLFISIMGCDCSSSNATTEPKKTGYSSSDLNVKSKAYDIVYSYDKVSQKFPFPLPEACQLIEPSLVSQLFNVDVEAINVNDGNPSAKEFRSCFFKWDDIYYPNTGILIQILRNPVPEEYPEYLSYTVANKRSLGENIVGASSPVLAEMFSGFGDDGSYSYEIGKYYWRVRDDVAFMLAFNMDISKEDQMRAARTLAERVMENTERIFQGLNQG